MDPSYLSALPNAKLWKRLFAIIYDTLIFMAVAMAYGAAVTAVQVALNGAPEPGTRAEMGLLGFIGLVVLLIAMCSFFWRHRGGQTLGMKAWRLRIIDNNGAAPNWGQCIARCLLGPLMLGLAGVGYWYSLLDKESRCIHDILSGTRMVQLPK